MTLLKLSFRKRALRVSLAIVCLSAFAWNEAFANETVLESHVSPQHHTKHPPGETQSLSRYIARDFENTAARALHAKVRSADEYEAVSAVYHSGRVTFDLLSDVLRQRMEDELAYIDAIADLDNGTAANRALVELKPELKLAIASRIHKQAFDLLKSVPAENAEATSQSKELLLHIQKRLEHFKAEYERTLAASARPSGIGPFE